MSKDQLKEERLKILELLAKGTINAKEAEELLSAMNSSDEKTDVIALNINKKAPFRMLKIIVDSTNGDKVRVQVPIEFAKLLKTGKINGIKVDDLNLDIDEILKMIDAGVVGEIVNVESAKGDMVKIFVE